MYGPGRLRLSRRPAAALALSHRGGQTIELRGGPPNTEARAARGLLARLDGSRAPLGLLDLALALAAFGMTIPQRVLGRIRALGGLLEASCAQVGVRADGGAWAPEPPLVRARLVSPRGGVLERVGFLTSYAAETIAEDARHAGRGACLDLAVDGKGTTNATLAQVRVQFGRLAPFGVRVRVRRGRRHPDPAIRPATKCDDTREELGLGDE